MAHAARRISPIHTIVYDVPVRYETVMVAAQVKRKVYPYSLVPGGAQDVREAKAAMGDPSVRVNYASFHMDQLRQEKLKGDMKGYVSYRWGNKIYWTAKPVTLHAGETVFTDGTHIARGRCLNCYSALPMQPIRPHEPTEKTMDVAIEMPATVYTSPELPLYAPVLPVPPAELTPSVPVLPGGGGVGPTAGGGGFWFPIIPIIPPIHRHPTSPPSGPTTGGGGNPPPGGGGNPPPGGGGNPPPGGGGNPPPGGGGNPPPGGGGNPPPGGGGNPPPGGGGNPPPGGGGNPPPGGGGNPPPGGGGNPPPGGGGNPPPGGGGNPPPGGGGNPPPPVTVVPEPSYGILLGAAGLAMILAYRRRKRSV